jgi:hypothetical protein
MAKAGSGNQAGLGRFRRLADTGTPLAQCRSRRKSESASATPTTSHRLRMQCAWMVTLITRINFLKGKNLYSELPSCSVRTGKGYPETRLPTRINLLYGEYRNHWQLFNFFNIECPPGSSPLEQLKRFCYLRPLRRKDWNRSQI